MSLSVVFRSVQPFLVVFFLLHPSIYLSLGLLFLHVPFGSHPRIVHDSLFPGILFTCPNYRNRFMYSLPILLCRSEREKCSKMHVCFQVHVYEWTAEHVVAVIALDNNFYFFITRTIVGRPSSNFFYSQFQ
jgi:hypothetical protein